MHHWNWPWGFSAGLVCGIGCFSKVNQQMIAASQAGSRGEVKGGVGSCGRFRRVRSAPCDAPLPCLMQPCSHVRAPPELSCFTRTAQCSLPHVLLGVCAHNMLFCAQALHAQVCAHCTHAHMTCAQHPCLAPIWINTVYKLSSLVVLQR